MSISNEIFFFYSYGDTIFNFYQKHYIQSSKLLHLVVIFLALSTAYKYIAFYFSLKWKKKIDKDSIFPYEMCYSMVKK